MSEFDKIIKLSDFLKENNAYKNFVKNFDLSYYSKYASSLEENVNFMNAFSWIHNNTNDWRKLNNEWDKLKYVSYDMNWLFMEKNQVNLKIILKIMNLLLILRARF